MLSCLGACTLVHLLLSFQLFLIELLVMLDYFFPLQPTIYINDLLQQLQVAFIVVVALLLYAQRL